MGIIHPRASPGRRVEDLERQVFAVGGKAFVQPDILPGSASHVIAKPLMKQLMGRECEGKPVLRGHGLVLHAATKWGHTMTIFFIGEGVEAA